jgi:hypothetical protein
VGHPDLPELGSYRGIPSWYIANSAGQSASQEGRECTLQEVRQDTDGEGEAGFVGTRSLGGRLPVPQVRWRQTCCIPT